LVRPGKSVSPLNTASSAGTYRLRAERVPWRAQYADLDTGHPQDLAADEEVMMRSMRGAISAPALRPGGVTAVR
jgi:hypothetical protein